MKLNENSFEKQSEEWSEVIPREESTFEKEQEEDESLWRSIFEYSAAFLILVAGAFIATFLIVFILQTLFNFLTTASRNMPTGTARARAERIEREAAYQAESDFLVEQFSLFVEQEFNGTIPDYYFNIFDGEIVLRNILTDRFHEFLSFSGYERNRFQLRESSVFRRQSFLRRMIVLEW